jgi:predicted nucleic acid-binding Zn ribbon protein
MIYVYHCQQCDEDIECEYRMGTQPEHIECPSCGCAAHRQYQVKTVHYRGTGWHWSRDGVRHGDPDMDDREREGIREPWDV